MAKKAPTIVQLSVANHALLEVPIHETHQRGRNWLAVINGLALHYLG